MSESKTCSKCLQTKSLDSFYKTPKGKQSHESSCIECRLLQNKLNYQNNKEARAIQIAQWQASNRDKKRHFEKLWRRNNPEVAQRWQQENRDKSRAYTKKFREKNPELAKTLAHKRRARMENVKIYTITKKDVRKILSESCIYCGSKSTHLDHVIPISRGGNHSIGNLAPACSHCNLSKGRKLIMEWKIWKRKMNSQ